MVWWLARSTVNREVVGWRLQAYPISTFHQLFDAERQGHYCKGTKMSNTYSLFESVVI